MTRDRFRELVRQFVRDVSRECQVLAVDCSAGIYLDERWTTLSIKVRLGGDEDVRPDAVVAEEK